MYDLSIDLSMFSNLGGGFNFRHIVIFAPTWRNYSNCLSNGFFNRNQQVEIFPTKEKQTQTKNNLPFLPIP